MVRLLLALGLIASSQLAARPLSYTSGTNRLGTLKSNGSSKTFQYNADGTMKTDGLRALTLTYNYLKLPRTVKRGTTSTVTYIYDAAGNKLAVSQDGTAKNYYCGDFVYDGSLAVAYILTPNGQLTRDPSTGTYTSQYNIPDHLGNVRSVVSSSGTVLQSTDYYPFGLAFADANVADNHLGRPFLIFRQIGARGSVIEGAWRPMDVRQQLKSGYGAHRHS